MGSIAKRMCGELRKGFLATLLSVGIPLMTSATPQEGADTASASKVYRLSMKDGTVLVGNIIRQTPDSIAFRTGAGLTMMIPQTQVEETEVVSGQFVNGEYKRYDPNNSRLFFGPTAQPVHGGYFSAYEIFFPFLAFGIADVVTIAGGMSLVPGATEQLYYIAPKITIPIKSENFSVAGGVLYTNILGDEGEGGAGIAYGVTTLGSNGSALTLGAGFGFSGGEWAHQPVLLAGGEARLSNSVALITENWFPVGSDVQLLSFGLRFFGDHLSADLGFFYPLTKESTEGFPFLPWLGFCYNFGH